MFWLWKPPPAARCSRLCRSTGLRDVNAVHGHIVLSRRFMDAAGQAAYVMQPSDFRF